MNKIKYLLLLFLCCGLSLTYAQKRISGHVFNPKDGPIMMANVLEIDANNRIQSSTQTDMSGNFALTIKNPKNKLKVYFYGYRAFEQVIGDKTSFRIQLVDNTQALKEVKVTGRKVVKSNGLTIPEREVSVATQKLDMDEMKGLAFESADQALQGQIAGLDVVANSGNLGSGMSMRVRGVTTISGNQEPLIVVDGHILENYSSTDIDLQDMDNQEQFANLLSVNVEDIKSIEVKKDAGACAMWGSRGSNGVIEITTRRGAKGKTKVSGNYYFSGSWQPAGMKMLNGDGYTMMLKEGYFNPRQSDLTSNILELMYNPERPMYYNNYNKNTDWVEEVTQFGQAHKFYVNLSGGGDQAQFRVSAGYDHETGTIIKQVLDRFSTRMTLDYQVSNRIQFSSNFSLTYTKNKQNYADILAKAYKAMPNMSIWRYDGDENTGEYFKMYRTAGNTGSTYYNADGSIKDGYSSYYLSDMVSNGNPVAIANLSWKHTSQYQIVPQFEIRYKLLGIDGNKTQLNYRGEVYMNSTSNTTEAYYPGVLSSSDWSSGINEAGTSSSRGLTFTTQHDLTFIPKLSEDHSLSFLLRGELSTYTGSSQQLKSTGLVGGITDPTVEAYLVLDHIYNYPSTSTSKSHGLSFLATAHYSFKSKYSLDATLRADGSTSFGKDKRWGYFPAVSARWNISDEYFFRPFKKVVNMLAFRPGWGITGNAPSTNSTIFNKYSSNGTYATGRNNMAAIRPTNMRLTTLQWEKTSSWNMGFNLGLFDALVEFDFNIYQKRTTNLLQSGVSIPTSTGFSSLEWANVGSLKNTGWELAANTRPLLPKESKFNFRFKFNASQNKNRITSMDASVLSAINRDFNYAISDADPSSRYLSRVQIGNALYSIYGFRYLGVYRYDYDHSGYFADESKNAVYGENTAAAAAARGENASCPIAYDANGNIIFDASGNPLRMYYNYGATNYQFSGGDAMYEDINHDGQINELDIVYLGNSNPTFTGGFGIDFTYGRWQLKTSFNIRTGAKIVNVARMVAEQMRTNDNQSRAVNWRWRKNGDITEIPRALNNNAGSSYNALASDRYVESGDFIRLQYVQLSYQFDPKVVSRLGLKGLRFSASGNNLFFFTKYKGVDPEHSAAGYSPAFDTSKTPRSRSVTFSLTVDF